MGFLCFGGRKKETAPKKNADDNGGGQSANGAAAAGKMQPRLNGSIRGLGKGSEAQRPAGTATPWQLLRGVPGSVAFEGAHTMSIDDDYVTVAAEDALATTGVLYYEMKIIKRIHGGQMKFGFSLKDGITRDETGDEYGIGDNAQSWAVDGLIHQALHDGMQLPWNSCFWKEGNTIGLAANVDEGKFAVSINGDWAGEGRGIAFENEAMKEGVFPCFSACLCSHSCVLANFEGSPPDEAFWKGAEVRKAWQKTKIVLEGLEQEKRDEEAQRVAGDLPVVRINGKPGSVKHNLSKKLIEFTTKSTAGVPEARATSGVLYYEITLMKLPGWSEPRFGFSHEDGISAEDNLVETGIGDDDQSYAVDGKQVCVHFDGKKFPWPSCSWKKGDVIGLAANIEEGKFAISINGEWSGEGRGLAFVDANMETGVYPCFTADECTIKCAISNFSGNPPQPEFWAEAKVRETWKGGDEVREASSASKKKGSAASVVPVTS